MTTPAIQNLGLVYSSALGAPVTVFGFNGQTSISSAAVNNFPAAGLTIEAWICTTQTGAGVIFSYDNASGDTAKRLWIKSPSGLQIGFGAASISTNLSIADGQWHHLSVTVAPSTSTYLAVGVWIDGYQRWYARAAIARTSGAWPTSGEDLQIGLGLSSETGFVGAMSEFRLWNEVLSAQAVMLDMQQRATSTNPAIVIVWGLDSVADSGTITGTVNFIASSPPLCFYPASARSLQATWTNTTTGVTTVLQFASSDNRYFAPVTQSGNSYSQAPPAVNVIYSVAASTVQGGTQSAWTSPVSVAAVDLGQPQIVLSQQASNSVQMAWPTIDQASSYALSFSGASASITQSGTSYDITTYALGTASVIYSVAASAITAGATTVNVFGPSSAAATAPTTPAVTLIYDEPQGPPGTLEATLSGLPATVAPFLTLTQQGQTSIAQATLAAAGTTLVDLNSTAVTIGQTYTAAARGMVPGAIGAWGAASTITCLDILGPSITTMTGSASANTIALTWAPASGTPANPTYVAELLTTGSAPSLVTLYSGTATSTVFTNAGITLGATFQAQVRALSAGTWGRWGQPAQLTVGGLPTVTGVNALTTVGGDLAINWSAVSATATVTYIVAVSGVTPTFPTTSTSENIPNASLGLSCSTVCSITVKATASGYADGPTSTPVVVTLCQSPLPPPQTNTVSDPINVVSGTFTYDSAEIGIAGVVPVVLDLYYSGSAPTGTYAPSQPLGPLWSHSYNSRLVLDSGQNMAWVVLGDQQIQQFQIPSSGSGLFTPYGAPPGNQLSLQGNGQYLHVAADGSKTMFASSGLPTTIADRYGNMATLAYTGSSLSSITDLATQRQLAFTYNSNGSLATAADGSSVPAAYARTVSFAYNSSGDLTLITNPLGNSRTLTYTGAAQIQRLVDPNGNTVASNYYDSGNHITVQTDGRGNTTSLSYTTTTLSGSGPTIVIASGTNRAGNSMAYQSYLATGGMFFTSLALDSQNLQAVSSQINANNQPAAETMFVGAAGSYSAGVGNTTTYQYDGNGNRTLMVVPLSANTIHAESRAYDANNNLLTVALYEGAQPSGSVWGMGNKWTFSYDSNNCLKTVVNPLGQSRSLSYASGSIIGLLTTAIDELGNTTSFSYAGGNLTQVVDGLGVTTTFTNDPLGRVATQTIGSGGTNLATLAYVYDKNSRPVTATALIDNQPASLAFTMTSQYDPNGNLTLSTDTLNHATTYAYSPNNFVDTITLPTDGSVTRSIVLAYDPNDYVSAVTQSSNATGSVTLTTRYVNDAQGRVRQMIDPKGNTYVYGYGMAVSGSGPYPSSGTTAWPTLAGVAQTYSNAISYDPLGRPTTLVDRNGQTGTIAYSTTTAAGYVNSVMTVTFPPAVAQSAATTYVAVFDPLGRPVSTTDQDNTTTVYTYGTATLVNGSKATAVTMVSGGMQRIQVLDVNGNLAGETLGSGTTTRSYQYSYDALQRLTTMAASGAGQSATATCSYGFNTVANCVTAAIGRPGFTTGPTLRYYDAMQRPIQQVSPFGSTVTWAYSPSGEMTQYVDGRSQTLAYSFDGAGRYTQAITPTGTLVHSLDANGNRTRTTFGSGTTITRTFDTWNRLSTRVGVEGATIATAYWPTNQLSTLTYSDGKRVTYAIDNLGRLTTVTDWRGRATTYSYTGTGMVTQIAYANGTTSSYNYTNTQVTGVAHASGGWIVGQAAITLDPLGQPKSAAVILPTAPTYPTQATTMSYGTGNQLSLVNGQTAAFDGDGNLTGIAPTTATYTYDVFGRLSQIASNPSAAFAYDPDGLRTATTIAGATSNFVYDIAGFLAPAVERSDPVRALVGLEDDGDIFGDSSGWPIFAGNPTTAVPIRQAVDRMLEQRDGSQTIQCRFVHGLGLIAHEDAAGNYRAYHDDGAGNTWLLTNSTGAVTDQFVFGPFGSPWAAAGSTPTPFLFGGRWGTVTDATTGLIYMRARSYSPGTARFQQPDLWSGNPFRPQTLNRYAYATGNPLTKVDPLGLGNLSPGAIAGAVIGSLVGAGILGGIGYGWWATGSLSGGVSWFGSAIGNAFGRAGSALGNLFGRGGGVGPIDPVEVEPLNPDPAPLPGPDPAPPPGTQIEMMEPNDAYDPAPPENSFQAYPQQSAGSQIRGWLQSWGARLGPKLKP